MHVTAIKVTFSKIRGLLNFYSISYLYFGAMATSSVVLVGLIVSYATGKKIKRLEDTLFKPIKLY